MAINVQKDFCVICVFCEILKDSWSLMELIRGYSCKKVRFRFEIKVRFKFIKIFTIMEKTDHSIVPSTPKWVTCFLECEACEENEKCPLLRTFLRTKGERK